MNITLASLSFLILSSPALGTATVDLAYDAPTGCPTRPEFVAAVASRGADFNDAETPAASRTLVVAIHKQADDFVGAFQVRDYQVATNKREVHGKSCGEVVNALAVVAAIELRPTGAAASPPSDPSPVKASTPTPEVPEMRLRGHTRFFPSRNESVQVGPGTLRFDLHRSITAYAGASLGLIPSVVLPRYDLSLTAANFVTTPEGMQRIVGTVTRTRLSFLGPASYSSNQADQATRTTTDINAFSFGIGVCQSPLYDTRGLVLLFCGELGGGFMNLRTRDAQGMQIQTKNAGFGTVTLGAEVQYNLASWFHVGAQLDGGATYGDLTAERADGSRIFGSSTGVGWTANVMLGVGGHF